MRIGIALILAGLLVMVATPATTRESLRASIEGKVEGRAEWFHWGTLGTSKPELKLELRGTKSRGNIVKYEWDFGDGSTAEGEYVTHIYYSGNWNITLTVYDKRGRSASETLKIEVTGGQPQAVQQEEPDIEERIKKKEELKKAEKKKLEKEKNFVWNPKERQIFTVSGERWVIEHDEFAKEIRKVLPRANSWGTSLSLLYLVKERLGTIKSSHTIFMIRREYLYHFEELEAEYPDLLPVSTEKLESYLKTYGYPLLYFSYDSTGMIRGVIIAKEVTPSLAKLLTKKPIPLDTPLQYENGELKKAEKKKLEKEKTFTWEDSKDFKEEVIITVTGRHQVNGCDEFAKELEKVVWVASCWGADSLLNFTETFINENRDIDLMKRFNTIFMVRPENLNFYDLEDFETKYPDLLPVSTKKLKSYLKTSGHPLLYFSLDYTGMLRGVIIAEEVTPALAKLLVEKSIPLDIPLQYKNGKLEKAKKNQREVKKSFTWNYKERLIITFTGGGFTGFKEFAKEARKVYGRRFNAWGTRSLLDYTKNKGRIEAIRSNNTIFTVRPESLYDLEDLEAEYPDLLPIPAEKLKSYLKTSGHPLLYFSLDHIGMLRGVIIAEEVTPALAKLLVEKSIPLDTPLGYENGRMEKLEK